MSLYDKILQNHFVKVEDAFEKYLPKATDDLDELKSDLFESVEYSLLSGGKRIRAVLLMEFFRLCTESSETHAALPFACATEMVHAYSLVHDDLPCMDNSDFRRGKLSTHKVFGETTALLAGDALLTLAFNTMLSEESVKSVGEKNAAQAAFVLSKAAGSAGMIGGQIIDICSENKVISVEVLEKLQREKTAALIAASCEIGCIVAGASEEKIKSAFEFGKELGLCFQIVDDILDVVADSKTLGKPVGADKRGNKSTYVSLLGFEKAKEIASEKSTLALSFLDDFHGDTSSLKKLTERLLFREK